jgi:hypothetical protein
MIEAEKQKLFEERQRRIEAGLAPSDSDSDSESDYSDDNDNQGRGKTLGASSKDDVSDVNTDELSSDSEDDEELKRIEAEIAALSKGAKYIFYVRSNLFCLYLFIIIKSQLGSGIQITAPPWV